MLQKKTSIKDLVNGMNYNVRLVFFFTFFASLGRGIWMGNVLSTYIYILADKSNEVLGLTSAAAGLTMTLVVIPAGILADRYRRDWILRGAWFFGVLGVIVITLADTIEMIVVALMIFGAFQGFNRPGLEAIFADSVESGQRSQIYAYKSLVQQFGMAAGPFINVGLFLVFGDIWRLEILRNVMLVGILLSLISLMSLLFFKDSESLGKASESFNEEEINSNKDENGKIQPSTLIPMILIGCNLLIGFGAGMTVKFFPIFFIEIYDMLPIVVQLIMGFTFLFTGILSIVAQYYSLRKGRVEMIFLVQILATACLALIVFYPPLWLLIPIFIVRGSLMNASQPLSRSILMDVVPKRNRGKLNSAEAIAWGLFWNISAVIGGFLIGPTNDFRLCFIVTVGLYILGTLPLLLLRPLVRQEEEESHSPSYF